MSAFERHAIQLLIDKATAEGITVPSEVTHLLDRGHRGSAGARIWVAANPDAEDPSPGCCWGSALDGPAGCVCWTPVYELEQQQPRPPQCPADLRTRTGMCGDCAFRPGSPERADAYLQDALFDLARSGTPFWCHDGMRRPVRYEHPDGRSMPGDSADWNPPMIGGIPYRADGQPGLLCAGWAAVATREAAR